MKRISEAISENMSQLTRGQRLLAAFVTEHCDRAAFMSSFDLAAVSGVSQSTVIRFAGALGYQSYTDLQQALQLELKYRLSTLERFELLEDAENDTAVLEGIAAADSVNIKKNVSRNGADAIAAFCTRLSFASKVYVYGQGHCAAAAVYLCSYLRFLMQNVCCINQTGEEPLFVASDIDSGDLLLVISFPVHSEATRRLAAYAHERGAGVAVISESMESDTGKTRLPRSVFSATPCSSKKRMASSASKPEKALYRNRPFPGVAAIRSRTSQCLVTLHRPLPVMLSLTPRKALRSSNVTRAPYSAAVQAAIMPAAPPPMIRISIN